MAVISCVELSQGRDGEFNVRQASRRYTRLFFLRTNDDSDGPAVVQAYLSLPALYSSYTSGNDADTAALVENIRVTSAGLRQWHAEVTYSTITPDSGQNAENPTDRNPTVRWSSQAYQVAVSQDVNGKAILNSAGDPFDPPIEREEKRMILSVERFENVFSPSFALQYMYSVNSDTFIGVPPGYARCNSIEGERHYEKNAYCWKVRYEFEFRTESYIVSVLDQGFRYLDSNSKVQTIRDTQGTAVSNPALLNGRGGKLADSTSTLQLAVDATTPFLTLVSNSSFPAAPFVVLCGSEKIYVGAVEGALSLTSLVRGYAGTTAAAHAIAATVTLSSVYLPFVIYRSLPFNDLNVTI